MMSQIRHWLSPLILIVGFSIVIYVLYNKQNNVVYVRPKIIEAIDNESSKQKEIIKEFKKEIIQIENSTQYLALRLKLDSLISIKDTTPYTTDICYSTVITQDSIIDKQKIVIVNQDKIISNDSLVKLYYSDIIKQKDSELITAEKKRKKSLWKGRFEGFVVGGVGGFFLGKVL